MALSSIDRPEGGSGLTHHLSSRSEIMLSALSVSKRFADVTALEAADLEVAAGSIHGLLGPKGLARPRYCG